MAREGVSHPPFQNPPDSRHALSSTSLLLLFYYYSMHVPPLLNSRTLNASQPLIVLLARCLPVSHSTSTWQQGFIYPGKLLFLCFAMHHLTQTLSHALRRAVARATKHSLACVAHKTIKFSNEGCAVILKGVDVLAKAVSVTQVPRVRSFYPTGCGTDLLFLSGCSVIIEQSCGGDKCAPNSAHIFSQFYSNFLVFLIDFSD